MANNQEHNGVASRSESQMLLTNRAHHIFHPDVEEEEQWEIEEQTTVEEEGQLLFNNFFHDQLAQTGRQQELRNIEQLVSPGVTDFALTKHGRELRHMGNLFARTHARQQVTEEAARVNLDINQRQFNVILAELFSHGGITRERIVVLFFFCTDVAVRALRKGIDLCSRFLQWSISFIKDRVCTWVRSCGGWSEVMNTSFKTLPRVAVLVGAFLVGFYFMRYIRKP